MLAADDRLPCGKRLLELRDADAGRQDADRGRCHACAPCDPRAATTLATVTASAAVKSSAAAMKPASVETAMDAAVKSAMEPAMREAARMPEMNMIDVMEVMKAVDEHERRTEAEHKRRPPERIIRIGVRIRIAISIVRIVRRSVRRRRVRCSVGCGVVGCRISRATVVLRLVIRLLNTPCAVRLPAREPVELLLLAVDFRIAADVAALLPRLPLFGLFGLFRLLRRLGE